MRCPKCGYFSFDYLTECGKCGISLGEFKEKLGLIGIKPAVPFFLGSLLKDGAQADVAADDWESPPPATESGLSELEFGEDFELDIGPPTVAAVPAEMARAEDESEFSLFDLGVPELQKEIHGEQAVDRKMPPELDLTLGVGPVVVPPPTSPGIPAAEADEGLTFDLSAEDFAEHAEIQGDKTGSGLSVGQASAGPGEKAPSALMDELPGGLVIELDDEDTDRSGKAMETRVAESTAAQDIPSLELKKAPPKELSLDFTEKDFAPGQTGPREDTFPVSLDHDELVLELVDEDSSPTVGLKEQQKPFTPDAAAAAGGETSVPVEASDRKSGSAEGGIADAPHDMVIELSDDDLETLLTELEGISGEEGKKADKASTDAPPKKG